jgi:hypothetical protein
MVPVAGTATEDHMVPGAGTAAEDHTVPGASTATNRPRPHVVNKESIVECPQPPPIRVWLCIAMVSVAKNDLFERAHVYGC